MIDPKDLGRVGGGPGCMSAPGQICVQLSGYEISMLADLAKYAFMTGTDNTARMLLRKGPENAYEQWRVVIDGRIENERRADQQRAREAAERQEAVDPPTVGST